MMTQEKSDWLVIKGGPTFRIGSGISIEDHHLMMQVFCKFLNDNGLAKNVLPSSKDFDWDNFELRHSHLTPEGVKLAVGGFMRWLRALDRGTSAAKTTVLSNALKKIRSSGPASE